MKVNIMTPDSIKHNLAAMKISAWHKQNGDEVFHNFPLCQADFTYASILFDNTDEPYADLVGGPKYPDIRLDPEINSMMPDYAMFNLDHSLGYTYAACPRTCDHCVVPKQNIAEEHSSIWTFHDAKMKKICLLNNNTLADHRYRETFQEIIDAKLSIIDENGYDARLITEEAASWLAKLKFASQLHLAWDYPEHEQEVLQGIRNLKRAMPTMFSSKKVSTYVLIGHTTKEEDMMRVTILEELQAEPFVMALDRDNSYQKNFSRWVNRKWIFKTVPWRDYVWT